MTNFIFLFFVFGFDEGVNVVVDDFILLSVNNFAFGKLMCGKCIAQKTENLVFLSEFPDHNITNKR